jgi:hypothetical protein
MHQGELLRQESEKTLALKNPSMDHVEQFCTDLCGKDSALKGYAI